jgi:hypothetical protein
MLTNEGKHRPGRITWLFFQAAEINRTRINSRWCAGFEASNAKRHLTQPGRQCFGWRITRPPAIDGFFANVNAAGQEGSGSEHNGCGMEIYFAGRSASNNAITLHQQVVNGCLKD